MLSNYPDHETYFSQPVNSISVFYVGKSKTKLDIVEVKIHKEFDEVENVEMDGVTYDISKTYIAFELTGAINHRDVSEGCNSVQAYSMLINALIWLFEDYCKEHGVYIYANDYNLGWNRRILNETFWYLNREKQFIA